MIKLLFISDLDGTIIYSGYPNEYCVEYRDSDEITYMTPEAYMLLTELLKQDDFLFIPCTLRSYEQTSRISFVKNKDVSLLICDNGFSIYKDDVLNSDWDKVMKDRLKEYPNENTYNLLRSFVDTHNEECRLKDNRNAFFTITFNNAELASLYYNEITSIIDDTLYNFDLQGRKMYVIPNFLNKALAVDYVCSNYSYNELVTAGDSSVDELFIKLGDIQIIPKHSKIQNDKAIITGGNKIIAGEEIIKLINSKYSSK